MTDQQAGLAKKEHGVDFPLGLTSVRIPLPGTATELVAVDEDVLSLLTPMSENYFHFVAEFLPRHVHCRPGTSLT